MIREKRWKLSKKFFQGKKGKNYKKFNQKEDYSPAGQFYNLKNSKIQVYIPSWVLEDMPKEKISLDLVPSKVKPDHSCIVNAFSAVGDRQIQMPKLQDFIFVAEEQAEERAKTKKWVKFPQMWIRMQNSSTGRMFPKNIPLFFTEHRETKWHGDSWRSFEDKKWRWKCDERHEANSKMRDR